MYPLCRSLTGNQIEELPAGVLSNNNKLHHLWVGRLKVHSRPIYFYYHILLQILVNSKILKYYHTTNESSHNRVERETLPFSSFSRVPQYIFVSDWWRFHRLIGAFSKPRLRWQRRGGKKKRSNEQNNSSERAF